MKNISIIISLLLLLFSVVSCQDNSKLFKNLLLFKNYDGEIILGNPNIGSNGFDDGILIYTPKTNNYLYVAKGEGYRDVCFSENKDKILGLNGDVSIIEYDLKTKTNIIVFKGNDEEGSYFNVKYVPKTDCISFISSDKLFILNRKTKEKEFITQAWGDYSWSKNGDKLFYSIGGKSGIYCFDTKSKKTTLVINEGFSPQLSSSNKYIAFEIQHGKVLIIKDIKTGKEWKYIPPIKTYYYKFSPDDKQLVIHELMPKNLQYNDISLVGWSYKTNEEVRVIKGIFDGCIGNFDWR